MGIKRSSTQVESVTIMLEKSKIKTQQLIKTHIDRIGLSIRSFTQAEYDTQMSEKGAAIHQQKHTSLLSKVFMTE